MTGSTAAILAVVSAVMALTMGYVWSKACKSSLARLAIELERRRLEAMAPTDPEYDKARETVAAMRSDTRQLGGRRSGDGTSEGGDGDGGGD